MKLGEHNLETAIDCEHDQCAEPLQVILPKSIIIPKEFDGLMLKHDVALIELSEPANITRYVTPACLPTGDLITKTLLNEVVEVAGWGWFDIDDPKSSPILQIVKLPVVSLDECRKIRQLQQFEFTAAQICVGGIAGKGKQTSAGSKYSLNSSGSQDPNLFLRPQFMSNIPHSLPSVITN